MKKLIISFAVLACMVSTAFVGSVCSENDFFMQGVGHVAVHVEARECGALLAPHAEG